MEKQDSSNESQPNSDKGFLDTTAQKPKRSLFKTVCLITTCFSVMANNTFALSSTSIALPVIGRELNIEQDRLQWVVSAFALSSGCFLLLSGRLADLHGRKLMLLLGAAWTAIFALGCGFAQNEVQINILRGLQGVGSAATIPSALGILAHAFPPSRLRSIAFATFSAGAPFGASLGFTMGGVVTEFAPATWRGNFFMTAGLAALMFLSGVYAIDPDLPSTEEDRRVDWVGATLVTVGLVLVTFVLGQGELASDGWRTPYIIALLIVGVIFIVGFLLFEHYLETRTTRPPLMRLDLWTRANGKFAAMQGIAFLIWCAFMSWQVWVTLYYQTYKNYSPVRTMVRFLPMTVTGGLLNVIVGIVVGWIDVLWLMVIGAAATGGACLLFALIDPSAPYWAFGFPSAVLIVGGADFIFSCGTLFVARVALPHEQSLAGGVFQTLTQLGTSFGLAITTIVHNKVVRRETAKAGIVPDTTGTNAPPEASLKGFQAAQWASFAFAMAALLLAVIFLRGVGVIGGKQKEPVPDTAASSDVRPEDGDSKDEDRTVTHSEA